MRVRDEDKVEARKKEILDIAKQIIVCDGVDALSIRKIATAMSQTPGIIYHYFENKDDLLMAIVKDGYGGILKIIRQSDNPLLSADRKLKTTLHAYIKGMLEQPYLYTIMMHSQHPVIQQQTRVMTKGICERHESMKRLQQCLKQGIEEGVFECANTEQRAQVIWSSMFGFLDRCIIEKSEPEQVAILLDEFLTMIIQSMKGK